MVIGPRTLAPAPMITPGPRVGWRLPLSLPRAAEGNALVDQAIVAKDRCFANHDTHTVVNEDTFTQLRAGMDFDTSQKASDVRDQRGTKGKPRFQSQ